jgi:predicted ATPase/DNA-binding winged helix-turn-helix (wHTH) protein
VADLAVSGSERAISFGPFRLLPNQRLLLEGEKPVRLGSRALDILIALTERAGEVVGKDEIVARVWPNTFVDESNLKFQVGALRRTLGDGHGGNRYLATIPGRGYSFVAPLSFAQELASSRPQAASDSRPHNLPVLLTRLIGRADIVGKLAAQSPRQRLLTIAGAGGIGKTSVALALGEELLAAYEDGTWLIDLAPLGDARLVPTALAAVLGLEIRSDNPVPSLIASLRDKKMLLVLDNCEHVIDAAATLAAEILKGAPEVHILATSREPLRAAGERVVRLPSLTVPSGSAPMTAAEALGYSAIELFSERVAATIDGFVLSDAEVPAVLEICRRLDGVPLALQLAAAQVAVFGIKGLAALLDDRLAVLTRGWRTALPRHQTLRAAIDWSFDLLPAIEQIVFRRLGLFRGSFTLEAAVGVAADERITAADVIESVANLAGKSLVATDVSGDIAYYGFLETTRAYALQKLEESGERAAYERRHARQCLAAMDAANAAWEALPPKTWLAGHRHLIDDVRAALDSSFRTEDEAATAVALTVAALPLWYQLSLLSESYQRAGLALALPAAARSPRQELRLYSAVAWSLMQIKGFVQETRDTWTALLALSRANRDPDHQLRALWGLWAARISEGALRTALALAEEFSALAQQTSEIDRRVGDRMLGHALHLLGEQAAAREHLERMLAGYAPPATGAQAIRYIFDQRALARCFLARISWLQGYPDHAMQTACDITNGERTRGDALSLCQVLVQAACPIGLMIGDLAAVEGFVSDLIALSVRYDWHFWHAFGSCFHGVLVVQRGDVATGLHLLEEALSGLRSIDFGVHYLYFLCHYASALGLAGRTDRGLETIEEAVARSDRNDERWCIAEVLRIKGELLHRQGKFEAADAAYTTARNWAERQGALSWSLRIATGAASLWQEMGRAAAARAELAAVCSRFTEGFETADYRNARAVLDGLNREVAAITQT